MRYTVVLEQEEDGGYVASVPALPGCVSQGDDRAEVLRSPVKPSSFTSRTAATPAIPFPSRLNTRSPCPIVDIDSLFIPKKQMR
jgi:hypothetical protein